MATAGGRRGPGPERAFCDPLPASGEVRLDAEEERHLVRVRRARAGDEVVLFDGRGTTRLGRLLAREGGAWVQVLGPSPDREPPRRVEVGCALPGAGRADDLVFALAESGVSRLVPLVCERSDPRASALSPARRERFARLAREAAKVSGRSRLLEVAPPRAPVDVVRSFGEGAAVALDPDPGLPLLPDVLPPTGPALLLVGPEGGFTAAELEALSRAGARLGTLGACALRVETAALSAAAIALAVRGPAGSG
jgi:16S rRNA (uracil1498-N3)-methyltransferase